MKILTINDFTDQYEYTVSTSLNFYGSHFQNLAEHFNELLPSAGVGVGAGFLSATAFRALAIIQGSMPPILTPRNLTPYFLRFPQLFLAAAFSARIAGDAYYNQRFNHYPPSKNLHHTILGTGLTFLSGIITLGETGFLGLMMTRSAIPMTGERILLLSILGGFLTSTQDMFLRNHYQIIDQPLQV